MRKLIAALALFAAPALAAIETTTITGTVYAPNGGAYPGKVTCTLSHAGTTSDGVNQQVVASYYTATINSDGSLSMTLVPNDVITPAGTWYSCEYTVQPVGGRRMTWVKTYSVTTAPDPVALGAVAILDNPSLTLPTISGASGTVQVSNGSGGLSAIPLVYGSGTYTDTGSGTDLDGNGTAASADFDGNGTVDETGSYWTATRRVDRLFGTLLSGSIDLDTTTGGAAAFTPGGSNISAVVDAWNHARLYGEPAYYLAPSWYDDFIDMMQGHPLYADCNGDGTAGGNSGGQCTLGFDEQSVTLSQCAQNNCNANLPYACIVSSDATSNGVADWNNDSTADLAVGDVITVESANRVSTGIRTHVVAAITDGDGTYCPSGSKDNQIQLQTYIDQDTNEGPDVNNDNVMDAGARIGRIWRNDTHLTAGGFDYLGMKIAYASRLLWGQQGPNLLENSSMDAKATAPFENWTFGPARAVGSGLPVMNPNDTTLAPATQAFACFEGTGSNQCMWLGTTITSGDYIESIAPIQVTPGEVYCLQTAVKLKDDNFRIGLVDDRDQNGTWGDATDISNLVDAAWRESRYQWHHQFYLGCWEIPAGVHAVKVRYTRGGTSASYPSIDYAALRRSTVWQWESDRLDPTSYSSMLINDPGSRLIIYTGDSWSDQSLTGGQYFVQGLVRGLNARFGRDLTAQVKAVGNSGDEIDDTLNNFYNRVEKYHPLYVIVHIGVNDVYNGTTTLAQWRLRLRLLASRIMQIGAVPVFIGPEPIGPTGNAFITNSRDFKDATRRVLMNWFPGPSSPRGPQQLCGAAAIDPANIATVSAGTGTDATQAGLTTNMACDCSPRTDWNAALLPKRCYPTLNTLNVDFYNPTGAGIDAGSVTVDYCCTRK